MKTLFTLIFTLLTLSLSHAAAPGFREVQLLCPQELAQSRAVVVIRRTNTPPIRLKLFCDQRGGFFLEQGDLATLVVHAIHPTLGRRRCAQHMPDWVGSNVCGMEGMSALGIVWRPVN